MVQLRDVHDAIERPAGRAAKRDEIIAGEGRGFGCSEAMKQIEDERHQAARSER